MERFGSLSHLKKLFSAVLIFISILIFIYPNNSLSETILIQENNLDLSSNIGSSVKQELEKVKKQLEENRKQQEYYKSQIEKEKTNKDSYNSEVGRLENQINLLNQEIAEKELIIQQLELEIEILTEEIARLEEEIKIAQEEIAKLEEETDSRLVNMYLDQKQNATTSSQMFLSNGPSTLVKTDSYRKAIQQDTNDKLEALQVTRKKLEKDKVQLEEDKITIDKNRKQLEDEKITLDRKKSESAAQRNLYIQKIQESENQLNKFDKIMAVLPAEEMKLVAKIDQLQTAALNRSEVENGLPITKGTFLGIEGNTGYSYGAHLHFGVSDNGVIVNPCSYLPGGAYGSCGGNGKVGVPLQGAVLTSGFRTKSRPSHNAIDVSSGGGGNVVAAHDGYVYFFFEPCPSWAPVCNYGGAIAAKVCEVDGCGSGLKTIYYHLSCTAEKGSSRSCSN